MYIIVCSGQDTADIYFGPYLNVKQADEALEELSRCPNHHHIESINLPDEYSVGADLTGQHMLYFGDGVTP